MKKNNLITIIIILTIILLSIIILNKTGSKISEEEAKCIGQNSIIYVQEGCSHCKRQEEMFGENYKYLNVVDCVYEKEKCITEGNKATPTWIIKNKVYEGFQTKDKLKEITGC